MCIALSILAVEISTAAVEARDVLSKPLAGAIKQDFFTFFHFQEKSREKKEGETIVMYATNCMGNMVILGVIVEGTDDRVKMMTLILDRKFVDDPKMGLFARDVAKSFLKDGVADADLPAIGTLVNEIAYGGQNWSTTVATKKGDVKMESVTLSKPGSGPLKKGDVAIMSESAAPKLPATPTAGYEAFLGKSDFKEKYSASSVRIQNKTQDGDKKLVMTISRL
jgi:hypothetical protein